MEKNKKSSLEKHSLGPSKKYRDENSNKGSLNSDESYKKIRPLVKEMPITVGPHHPHYEEILDGI